ncbi:sigma factor-like helix-turn-helix DNA-binding protein [Cetobacterium sp.]|uniref:sigma factor-like helix-turn-helix DNA-binding protein n=1 Tax=Cetobacterium sp. TaxID=2071632 RepID=UPI003AF1003B
MEKEQVLLELMYDMIEKILSPREFEVYTLSKRMKPRDIADRFGVKSVTVRKQLLKAKKKIELHKEWLEEKARLRGLVT